MSTQKKLMSSLDYLKEALNLLPGTEQKEKAAALKISQPSISMYLKGERIMDDFTCIMVAKTLGIDPMRIIAAAQEEREKNEERRGIWRDFRAAREQEKGQAFVPVMVMLSGLMMMGIVTIASQSEWSIVLHTLKLCELQ